MSGKAKPHARTGRTIKAFRQALEDNLYYARGASVYNASPHDAYVALAYTVRDHLVERWRRTLDAYAAANTKVVNYLSAEYLLGRQLPQDMLYSETTELARKALQHYKIDLDLLERFDVEPGLGNGGLGRLAACFLDSLATLGVPAVGYGIRYEFGIFNQSFVDGWQHESPDEWLHYGNPWEFAQPDDMVPVHFGGQVVHDEDEQGRLRARWLPEETVLGEPYIVLVPGFDKANVNILKLWRARASQEFDFQLFDTGDYVRAVDQKIASENLSKVLYPNDNTPQGQELRLKQQYFFVACSLRDILRRFSRMRSDLRELAAKEVIQLNDTHPVLAIPELLRILVDEEGMAWDEAWAVSQKTFGYTCHTLLPEALERWPVDLFARLLPRHLEIVYEINHRFLDEVRERFPGDDARVQRMSLIDEEGDRRIRMANLAVVGSFSVNGVAKLQSELLKERTLPDFAEMWPERFNNKTNGVTPRRFMRIANPRLADLITTTIGKGWLTDLDRLEALEPYAKKVRFPKAWHAIKLQNKKDLAARIRETLGIEVDPTSMYDVMVKRLHEYKRQLLKALHVVTLYHRIQDGAEPLPRTVIFGAKAAPGYHTAKLIIKLINSIADVVNNDPQVGSRLKVAFLPNFNVTLAQQIYPAADLSEQISMAGKEASGTGNMKFALNGALTCGTLDGANIEIRDLVGAENFFLFGLDAAQVLEVKEQGYEPRPYYEGDAELRRAIDAISAGEFSGGDGALFRPLVDGLLGDDEYLVLRDFGSYRDVQDEIEVAFTDVDAWTRMSILNTARCGFFSSDRAMREYCADIWQVKPVRV